MRACTEASRFWLIPRGLLVGSVGYLLVSLRRPCPSPGGRTTQKSQRGTCEGKVVAKATRGSKDKLSSRRKGVVKDLASTRACSPRIEDAESKIQRTDQRQSWGERLPPKAPMSFLVYPVFHASMLRKKEEDSAELTQAESCHRPTRKG